jgi:energy-coupling factor transporter transmembrane protein EcfT
MTELAWYIIIVVVVLLALLKFLEGILKGFVSLLIVAIVLFVIFMFLTGGAGLLYERASGELGRLYEQSPNEVKSVGDWLGDVWYRIKLILGM